MDKGFILLSRNILESEVFASQKLLKIWVWCLCKSNFKDRNVPLKVGKGETIVKVDRGSFIFGRHKAEEELFIDGSTIYKSMKQLEKLDMISITSNNQYSIVKVNKYNDYQDTESYKVTTKEQPSNNQVTTKEQPSNTTNTLKQVNNDNKENIKKGKNEIFAFELLQSEQWIETIAIQNKIKIVEVSKWIDIFLKKLITELDVKISKKEFGSHFSRWLPNEILKLKISEPKKIAPDGHYYDKQGILKRRIS